VNPVIEFTPAPPPGERADLQAVGYLRTEYFAGLIIHHLWSTPNCCVRADILTTYGDRIPIANPFVFRAYLQELRILPTDNDE